MENKQPLVSVLMLTYNHGGYIAQALDSVLMQKVKFDYEIVIGDDCSPDNTSTILLKYKEQYPEKIKMILRKKNIGATKNFVDVLKQCTGKYIANLEGDDYWTDENKLQIQVDFLEKSPEYSACFHSANIIDENEKITDTIPKILSKDINSLDEFFSTTYCLPTASVVYRKFQVSSAIEKLLLTGNYISDYIIDSINISKGKMKFINRNMSVYRQIYTNNSYSSVDCRKSIQEAINVVTAVNIFFSFKYDELLKKRIRELNFHYLGYCTIKMAINDFLEFYKKNLSFNEKLLFWVYFLKKIIEKIYKSVFR